MTKILTCKIGKFTFEDDVPYSLAKLLRDTVMGQMLAPKQREQIVETEEDAHTFMAACESAVLRNIPFELELHEDFKSHQMESLLQSLAEQAHVTSKQMSGLSKRFGLTLLELSRALKRYRELAAEGVFV